MIPAPAPRRSSPTLISSPIKWSSIELHAGDKIDKIQKLNKRIQALNQQIQLISSIPSENVSKEEYKKYKTIIDKNKKLFVARSEGKRIPIDQAMISAENIWRRRKLPSLVEQLHQKKNELEKESTNLSRALETLAGKYAGPKGPDVLTNKALAESIRLRISENNAKEYDQQADVILAQIKLDFFDPELIENLKKTEAKFDPLLKPVVVNFVKYLNKVPEAESPALYLLPLIAKAPLYAAHLLDAIPLDVSESARDYLMEKLNLNELAAFAKACVLYDGLKVLNKQKQVTEFLRGNSFIELIPAYYQKLYLGPAFSEEEWTSFFMTCLSINGMEIDPKNLPDSEKISENQTRILPKATNSLDKVMAILVKNRDVIPIQLRQVYQTAWDILTPYNSTEPNIQKKQLALFFFLRFFNPQLVAPKTAHAPLQQRDATLVAKILQSVANNELPNEPFMQFIENFVKERQPQIEAITTLLRE